MEMPCRCTGDLSSGGLQMRYKIKFVRKKRDKRDIDLRIIDGKSYFIDNQTGIHYADTYICVSMYDV